MFKVAILGRTNVGKTTLFNRLINQKESIVHNSPNVTRDKRYANMKLKIKKDEKISIMLIDTAGLDADNADKLQQKAFFKSIEAMEDSDLSIFLVDGRSELLQEDYDIYKTLKKKNKTFITVINKVEKSSNININNFNKISGEKFTTISAEHNIGINDLLKEISLYYQAYVENNPDIIPESECELIKIIEDDMSFFEDKNETINDTSKEPIRLTIIGRPNAGKSTIVNKILREDRVITDPTPGTTRDSIRIPVIYKKRKIDIIDTAGIRKKMNIDEGVEEMSVQSSIHAIDLSHITALVTDARNPIEFQDKHLLNKINTEGKPCMVICNKWDLINEEERNEILKSVQFALRSQKGVDKWFFTVSALKDDKLTDILDETIKRYESWNRRIPTKKLNNWLRDHFLLHHETPLVKKKKLKLKFIAQTSIKPPSFTVFCNIKHVPNNYIRSLENKLIEDFNFQGTPIRIHFTASKNPFIRKRPRR